MMTAPSQELLNTFDELSDSEQLEVALEILRRFAHMDFPPLEDEDLVLSAEALFLELDQQESENE
jgi:hypothetical protein